MTIEHEHVGEMELILPQNPEIGLTIKIEANRPLNIRLHPRAPELNPADYPALANPYGVQDDN
jgi:hypothetical protein